MTEATSASLPTSATDEPSSKGLAERAPGVASQPTDESISRAATLGLGALLVLVVSIVYSASLSGAFIYDDGRLISSNPNVGSLGAAFGAFFQPLWAFAGEDQNAFWRPLTVIALALGRAISGFDPTGYHVLSLALHALASLVAWRLGTRLTKSVGLGFAVGLVFAVHPVHVESVAWISAINDPLHGLFALLAIDGFVRWRERGSKGVPIASGVWLFCSLLSKELALVIPPILLLIDGIVYSFGRDTSKSSPGAAADDDPFADLLRAYAPVIVAVALYWAGRVIAFDSPLAGLDRASAGFDLSPARTWQFRVEIFGGFLELLMAPFDLIVFRQVRPQLPADYSPWPRAIAFTLLWVASTGLFVWRRWRIALAMSLALPVSFALVLARFEAAGGFPISDRYLYVPVFFAALLLAVLLSRVAPRAVTVGILVALSVLGGARSYAYSKTFGDEEVFFRRAVLVSPDNAYVRWGLGRVLLDKYRRTIDRDALDEAAYHYLVSLKLGSDYGEYEPELDPNATFAERALILRRVINETPPSARTFDETVLVSMEDRKQANLGWGWCTVFLTQYSDDFDLEWAQVVFESALRMWPDSHEIYTALGVVYMQRGMNDDAEKMLREALRINAYYAPAWHNLGQCMVQLGKLDEARVAFEEALRFRPGHLKDLIGAAKAAIDAKRFDIGARHLAEAAKMHPGSTEPVYWNGMLAAARGDMPSALARFDRVLARQPDHPTALLQKGKILASLGEVVPASQALGRACELSPSSFEAYYSMAGLLLATTDGQVSARPYLRRAYELSSPTGIRQELHVMLAQLLPAEPTELQNELRALARMSENRRDYVHALDWTVRLLALMHEDPNTDPQIFAYLNFKLGSYLSALGEKDEAVSAWHNTLRIDPEHFQANHDLALTYAIDLGKVIEARPYAQKALELLEARPEIADPAFRKAMRNLLEQIVEGNPDMGPPLMPEEPGDGE